MAERAGFEPAEPEGSRALQARALGRTMQPLRADTDEIIPLDTAIGNALGCRGVAAGSFRPWHPAPPLCDGVAVSALRCDRSALSS